MFFITSNNNKFSEARKIIPDLIQYSLNLEEIQSLDITEISKHKLRQAYTQVRAPCIIEDVSFEIADLNGLPGPFIKYFAQALGEERIAHLALGSQAVAICCVGYHDGKNEHLFIGRHSGTISLPQGVGFGFDSIFIPQGESQSTAELGVTYKNEHSHRAKAFSQLAQHIKQEKSR